MPIYQSNVLSSFCQGFGTIKPERKEVLSQLAEYLRRKMDRSEQPKLIFICTHNSRRSHFGQIWAQVAAYHYGLRGVATYSGGTKATAVNPRAAAAMVRAGLDVQAITDGENPTYEVAFSPEAEPMRLFSKTYSHRSNPSDGFAAVMTCSQADEACPVVLGAEARIALPYDDPKDFDGTTLEAEKYDERCRQIATEMFFAFSLAVAN